MLRTFYAVYILHTILSGLVKTQAPISINIYSLWEFSDDSNHRTKKTNKTQCLPFSNHTNTMTTQILTQLNELARTHNVRILYACETGSRGWGFASPDSDFDIRFVFVHPLERYLAINEPQDSITQMITVDGELLDLSGWDLRKLLALLRRSNATPFEWLQSPCLYMEQTGFRDALWALAPQFASPRALIHHYLGICHNSIQGGISNGHIKIKKYFYILRPLLAASWTVDLGTVPPMEFAPLLKRLSDRPDLLAAINRLWAEKEQAVEAHVIPLIPEIQVFIESEMQRCKDIALGLDGKHHPDPAPLNAFFRKWLD